MNIQLRKTKPEDLNFVIEAERAAENRRFIGQWEVSQHLASLQDQNFAHYLLERISDLKSVGYIILSGLAGIDRSIEFCRLVVTEKSRGYGKEALLLVKDLAFTELNANRLWLDVRDHNHHALTLYQNVGFTKEGLLRECVQVDDHFESLIILSMLKSEYGKD